MSAISNYLHHTAYDPQMLDQVTEYEQLLYDNVHNADHAEAGQEFCRDSWRAQASLCRVMTTRKQLTYLFIELGLQRLHFQHEIICIGCRQVNCAHDPF